MTVKQPPINKTRSIVHDDDDDQPIMPMSAITQPVEMPAPLHQPRQRRRNLGRGAYPNRRQVTAYIQEELFVWLKSISVSSRKSMLEIMEEALTNHVKSYTAQKKFQGTKGGGRANDATSTAMDL